MIRQVPSKVSFPELEKEILQLWKDNDIFHRTEQDGDGKPLFMLFEGPPTANGSPGIHHVLARVFKDIICRYKTMKGYRLMRKGGWDTHGLPVELEVERELGLHSKREIEEYGIEKFNQKCRESVFRYVKEWEEMTDRVAYWVDMEHPYVTLDNSYIETGWWILRQLWDKGLLYQDMKGTPHCPRCVTSLSSHEVALGYREDTPDPSVFIKFRITNPTPTLTLPLGGGENLDPTPSIEVGGDNTTPSPSQGEGWDGGETPTYFLAWTTTPWTLPGNTALAIGASAEYSLVEIEGEAGSERLILATPLLESALNTEYKVVQSFKGSALVGLQYEPLFDPFVSDLPRGTMKFFTPGGLVDPPENADGTLLKGSLADNSWQVHAVDFVSMEDGTGIVHMAPAFGDEDLGVGRDRHLALVQNVDLEGKIVGNYPGMGKFVKDADDDIAADLQQRGLLYHKGIYKHTYPFCWRCNTPLLYYAKPSWYIRTTAAKERLVSGNREINWYPDYIKEGRFGEWLANNVDWAISRERYWGTPIPIWRCTGDECTNQVCIGSRDELKELAIPEDKPKVQDLDLHRPYVDRIHLLCASCGSNMERIPEVMDAWFDSGAMPFAQWHYPFEGSEMVQDGRFPADYICEAVDQTRGWFYSLHALSILLMDGPSYRNVICLGLILDGNGRKMSKSQGNVVNPWTVLDEQGADATRWYLFTAAHAGESRRFAQDLVNEVVRRFLLTLWNVYSFFTTYASVDGFHPDQVPAGWKPTSELDRWLLSELNNLVAQVDKYMDEYNPTDAGRRIQDFVDGLSNWYVRRSRRRFWKSENDEDKLSAYATLHTCLTTLSKLIAPFMPFVAEEMYQNLVRSVDPDAADSVHLASFPQADEVLVDQGLMEATRLAMKVSSMGRGARSRAGVKVRQPLGQVLVRTRSPEEEGHLQQVAPQILDELNIKELKVIFGEDSNGDKMYQQALEAASSRKGRKQKDQGDGPPEAIVQLDQYWISVEGGYMVALDTSITPELAQEGLARELVHRIQDLRKKAGFEITDRILTCYQGPDSVSQVMDGFSDYIMQETLSTILVSGQPAEGFYSETQKIDGMETVLGVQKFLAEG